MICARARRTAAWTGALLGAVATVAGPWLGPTVLPAQPRITAELRVEAARLFRDLGQRRGREDPGRPPALVVRGVQDRRRFVRRELARKYPPARLEAERQALVAWGLVPPGFDLGSFLTDLVVEQAAAYYDPMSKSIAFAAWLDPAEQRQALTHELVHALQDRQVDLDRFLAEAPGEGDAALARQALVEGEAVALTLELALQAEGLELARLPDVSAQQRAILVSATGPALARAPRFLRATLTFPYAHGLSFVHQLVRQHGWPALGDSYRDPPRSSAEILHPDRYLERRRGPTPVALPDLGPVLGPGTVRLHEDRLGEHGLREVLARFGAPEQLAEPLHADRYALWHRRDTVALVALTGWGAEADARAFATAYAELIPRKREAVGGLETPALWTGTRGGLAFAVERQGTEVLIVEQVPRAALAALRRAVWHQRATSRP